MKKITGIALAVALILSTIACLCVGVSAATLTVNAGIADAAVSSDKTKEVSPSVINAYYVHNVIVNNDGSRNVLTPVNGQFTSEYNLDPNGPAQETAGNGAVKDMKLGAQPENIAESNALYNPYVCYKLSADSGCTVDGLSLHIKGYLRDSNSSRYQIGVWVTDSFEHDGNGAYDFTASDYALLISSEPGAAWNSISSDGKTEYDLSDAAKALNSRDVYVIFLLNRGYGAEDATRLRITELELTATQAAGSAPSGGPDVVQGDKIVTDANIAAAAVNSGSAVKASGIGAFYVHNVAVNSDGSRNVLTPVDGQFTANYDLDPDKTLEGGEKVRYGAQTENIAEQNALYNPYVAYKFTADKGNAIDTLAVDINYYLRAIQNDCYYQIGIWVTDSFKPDGDGAYDFAAAPYAALLTSTSDAVNRLNGDPETVDLTKAVKALGEPKEVYVIFLLNRGFGGNDATRLRINQLTLTATQKIASTATSDVTACAVTAAAVICAAGIIAFVSGRRKED